MMGADLTSVTVSYSITLKMMQGLFSNLMALIRWFNVFINIVTNKLVSIPSVQGL